MELPPISPDATKLSLRERQLTSLPEEITQLTNLTSLDLPQSTDESA